MTPVRMKAIEEANTPKYRITYEFVNDEGSWELATSTALSLHEVNMKLERIATNNRTRKGMSILIAQE